jgi:TolB-like protein
MRTGIVALLTLLALVGCSLRDQRSTLYVEPRTGSPVVYVHPMQNTYQEATVGVLPFQVPENVAPAYGTRVAALFKDVLLGRRAFPIVRQLSPTYGDLDEALARGKEAKVDLVLAGRVNYALAATEMGGGRVSVSMRLLNVHSGNTVWYIEQAIDQPMDYPESGMLSRLVDSFGIPEVRPSTGAPVVPNMLAKIAVDMAEVMAGARMVSRN